MKKVFLLILAGGIMFTACKKDVLETKSQSSNQSWKTSHWMLTKSNVNINGILCDEYTNRLTHQIVYEAKSILKATTPIKFEYKRETIYGTNNIKCDDPGDNCWKGKVDGIDVFITRRDK
ncbi:MAG: hypothetical protein N2449_09405 [Bacteroidales bacterium]|nr:hypothetical protein [Bacteroidales bacterium]